MTRRHNPRVKTRTCISCVSCSVKIQQRKRNIKMNKLSDREAPLNYEMSQPVQLDNPVESPRRGPCVLSVHEENLLCEHILTLSKQNFVFSKLGLRMFVKAYLDRLGIRVDRFNDNFPGKTWATKFLKRHNQKLYVLEAQKPQNPAADRIEVSRAIVTGFREELMSLIEAQPSEETLSSNCDTTGSRSTRRRKVRKYMQFEAEEPMKKCQEKNCSSRFRAGGDHDFCLAHSLCIQDGKFSPENCPVCSSYIAQLLKLPDKDLIENRMHQLLKHRWKRARENYTRKGKTLPWSDPALAKRLHFRVLEQRKRSSEVTNMHLEKRVKIEIKKEDIEMCESQNNKYGKISQQEGSERGLEKSKVRSREKKERMGDLKDEATERRSAEEQIVRECLRIHTSKHDLSLKRYPNISQEFPKVVLKRLSLDALRQYRYSGSAVKCSSRSDSCSLEMCHQKLSPKGTKCSSHKAVPKVTSNRNASCKVTPKIISKNGLKVPQRRSPRWTSLKTDLDNDLKGTLDYASKIKKEIGVKNINNNDDAPESIPPQKIFGGLSESVPPDIPKWAPQSTGEDSLRDTQKNGSESMNKKFQTYCRGNSPKSSQDIPVALQKSIPELPSEVTRELQQLRTKLKCLEAKCERLEGVEKDRRWLADMCAKKEANIRHLREEVKKADSQHPVYTKLKRKEVSVKLWKEKYLSLLKLHTSYVKQSIKCTVNTGVQVSQSEEDETQQEMLKGEATQLPEEPKPFQETSTVESLQQEFEVKDPLQAANFWAWQSNSCSPKVTENLQSPEEVVRTNIKLQTLNLEGCQQKPESQLIQNSQQTEISQSEMQVFEELPVNHLLPESAAVYQISKSHTPKHTQLSHTTHLEPQLQTPELLSVGQILQSTPTCQTPQTTCTLQTTQLTPVSQTPQITPISQSSQLMLTSQTSQPPPVPENSHLTLVSQTSQLAPASENSQVTPLSQTTHIPPSQSTQVTPAFLQSTEPTPVSQTTHITGLRTSHLAPTVQITQLPQDLQVAPASQITQVTPSFLQSTQPAPVSQTRHISDLQTPHLAPTVQMTQLAPDFLNSRFIPGVHITQQETETIYIEGIMEEDLLFGAMMENGIQVQQESLIRQRITNHSSVMMPYTPTANRPVLKPVEQTVLQTVHRSISAKMRDQNKLEAVDQNIKTLGNRAVCKVLDTSNVVDPDYEMVIVVP